LVGVLGESSTPHPDVVANVRATTIVAAVDVGDRRTPTVWRLLADEDPTPRVRSEQETACAIVCRCDTAHPRKTAGRCRQSGFLAVGSQVILSALLRDRAIVPSCPQRVG